MVKKKQAQEVALTVVEEPSLSHVGKKLSALDYQQLLADTEADFAQLHRLTAQAAERALRIGVRMFCLNQTPKALATFIKLAKGKPGMSQSALYRFMELAEGFLKSAGYIDDKHKLIDAEAVKPLMDTQLELWDAKREDAIGEAMRWISGRGMMEILRDMSAEEKEVKKFGGQLGNTSAKVSPAKARELLLKAAAAKAEEIMMYFKADVYFAGSTDTPRKTLAEVASMRKPALSWSLWTPETITDVMATVEQWLDAAKHLELQREGQVPVKRGRR